MTPPTTLRAFRQAGDKFILSVGWDVQHKSELQAREIVDSDSDLAPRTVGFTSASLSATHFEPQTTFRPMAKIMLLRSFEKYHVAVSAPITTHPTITPDFVLVNLEQMRLRLNF